MCVYYIYIYIYTHIYKTYTYTICFFVFLIFDKQYIVELKKKKGINPQKLSLYFFYVGTYFF